MMEVRKSLIAMLSVTLLVGLPACGAEDQNPGEETNPGESQSDADQDATVDAGDAQGEDAAGDVGSGGDAGDSDDTGEADEPVPADIVVYDFSVWNNGGNEWAMSVDPYNPGDTSIVVGECTYEARTVADDQLITEGKFYENYTLRPPTDGPVASPQVILEFEPSLGDGTVEAQMVVECVAAEGETEASLDNNTGSANFDW